MNGLGIAADHIDLLHWGINFEQIQALETSELCRRTLGLQGKVVLSLGHLGPIKGHDDSIRAVAKLTAKYPDIRLYIAGDGAIQDRQRLTTLIKELQLGEHVTLLGQISQALQWMKACDIFLQPSREEGFGLVFLEAGACEKPVIATHVGGIPDIIESGKTGILVAPEQPEEIATALDKLLGNPDIRSSYGKEACMRVTQHFNLNDKITQLESILKKYCRD